VIQGDASQSAADTQAGAANNATNAQLSMFNTVQQNLQPYNQAGQNALTYLNGFLNDPRNTTFHYDPANDPLYNFMLSQGGQAITNQASALGGVNSGNTLRALSDYGQKTALSSYQTEYNNWLTNLNNTWSRLYNASSLGENAAAGVGNAALQTGANIGSNMIGAGNAQAAGQIGQANALNGGLQSIFTNLNGLGGSGSFGGVGGVAGPSVGSSESAPQILYGGGNVSAPVLLQ
jgi:hypothetical protein